MLIWETMQRLNVWLSIHCVLNSWLSVPMTLMCVSMTAACLRAVAWNYLEILLIGWYIAELHWIYNSGNTQCLHNADILILYFCIHSCFLSIFIGEWKGGRKHFTVEWFSMSSDRSFPVSKRCLPMIYSKTACIIKQFAFEGWFVFFLHA